jgi:Erv1/Alr family protein
MTSTKKFGPALWHSLFCIAINYPKKIDIVNNPSHKHLVKYYKRFFSDLQYIIPCIHCRNSYKNFIKIYKIDNYLNSRKQLVLWLYKIKDLVNKKLISQEKSKLYSEIHQLHLNNKNLTKNKLQQLKTKHFYTSESPPFDNIYNHYLTMKSASNKCK